MLRNSNSHMGEFRFDGCKFHAACRRYSVLSERQPDCKRLPSRVLTADSDRGRFEGRMPRSSYIWIECRSGHTSSGVTRVSTGSYWYSRHSNSVPAVISSCKTPNKPCIRSDFSKCSRFGVPRTRETSPPGVIASNSCTKSCARRGRMILLLRGMDITAYPRFVTFNQ